MAFFRFLFSRDIKASLCQALRDTWCLLIFCFSFLPICMNLGKPISLSVKCAGLLGGFNIQLSDWPREREPCFWLVFWNGDAGSLGLQSSPLQLCAFCFHHSNTVSGPTCSSWLSSLSEPTRSKGPVVKSFTTAHKGFYCSGDII